MLNLSPGKCKMTIIIEPPSNSWEGIYRNDLSELLSRGLAYRNFSNYTWYNYSVADMILEILHVLFYLLITNLCKVS